MSRLSEITQTEKDNLHQHAKKAQTVSLPIMHYKNGAFEIGTVNPVDVTGTEFIAVVDQCAEVWNRFENNSKEESLRFNVLKNGVHGRPSTYTDKEQWPTDSKSGRPSDPWGNQYELPMIAVDDGRVVLFRASTQLAKAMVGRVLAAAASQTAPRRPFVTVTVTSNDKQPPQMVPDLVITGYCDDDGDVPGLSDVPGFNDDVAAPLAPATAGNGSGASSNADMDDDFI
jgi:hypothetical protein